MTTRPSMRVLFAAGLLLGSLALFGCPKRPEVMTAAPTAAGPSAAVAPASPAAPAPAETPVTRPSAPAEAPAPPSPPAAAPAAASSPLKDVFFDFDKSAIRADQKAVLTEDAAWLKANVGAKVTVEGHCDERGTVEYNLALGERRAKAVKDFLVAAGVKPEQVSVVSYGKERPFVLGHDESAWKWNRRGHMVITAQ